MKHFLDIFFEVKNNGTEVASLFVNLLNVKISNNTLKTEIKEHPDYPSLLSISDVLNRYGVENIVAKFEQDNFFKIPTPFITQIKGVKESINYFTIVKEVDGDIIYYFDPEKHKWTFCYIDTFLNRCTLIALLAEQKKDAGERDYDKKNRQDKSKRITHLVFYF